MGKGNPSLGRKRGNWLNSLPETNLVEETSEPKKALRVYVTDDEADWIMTMLAQLRKGNGLRIRSS